MTFQEFIHAVQLYRMKYTQQRVGQAFFNVLYEVRPDISEQVRATTLDPFYRNDRVAPFLRFVKANW